MSTVETWNRPHDIPAGTVVIRCFTHYNGKAEDAAAQEWRALDLVRPLGGTFVQSLPAPTNSWAIDIRCPQAAAANVAAALKAGGFQVTDDESKAARAAAAKRAAPWLP